LIDDALTVLYCSYEWEGKIEEDSELILVSLCLCWLLEAPSWCVDLDVFAGSLVGYSDHRTTP